MIFARTEYNDAPEWGVVEEKYIRLIDGAPYDAWSYLGTEVRRARAKVFAPATGQLLCVREVNGVQKAPIRKAAYRAPAPGSAIPCPNEGMDCLCGLAAMLGKTGEPIGFTAFGGGAIGPYLCAELPEDGRLVVSVGGTVRREESLSVLRQALLAAIAQAAKTAPLATGDVVALASPAGLLCPRDALSVQITGMDALWVMAVRRAR